MSTSAWVTFKWLRIPLTNRQPPHNWLMSLAMHLAVLCDVEVKMASMDVIWLFLSEDIAFACHFVATYLLPTL